MNCIVCNHSIPRLEDTTAEEWKGMWDSGAVDRISVNYGSKFDGDMYVVAICDNCLESKLNSGVIKFIGNYMKP